MSAGEPIIARTWDQLPPTVYSDGEWYSTRVLADQHRKQAAEIERLRAIVDAQRSLIVEYEYEFDVDNYEDDELPDEIASARKAVKAAERRDDSA